MMINWSLIFDSLHVIWFPIIPQALPQERTWWNAHLQNLRQSLSARSWGHVCHFAGWYRWFEGVTSCQNDVSWTKQLIGCFISLQFVLFFSTPLAMPGSPEGTLANAVVNRLTNLPLSRSAPIKINDGKINMVWGWAAYAKTTYTRCAVGLHACTQFMPIIPILIKKRQKWTSTQMTEHKYTLKRKYMKQVNVLNVSYGGVTFMYLLQKIIWW